MDSSDKIPVLIVGLLVSLILGVCLYDLRKEQSFIDAGYQKDPICRQMDAVWVAPSPKSALRNVLAQ